MDCLEAEVTGSRSPSVLTMEAVTSLGDLREVADRDGAVFIRGLMPVERIRALRDVMLDFFEEAGWLDGTTTPDRVVAREGVRAGDYHAPEWVSLQAHAQGRVEFRELGGAPEVEALVRAALPADAAPYLSLANTVRVFSPHPELATPPHQDGHFVQTLGNFWTLWLPLTDCPIRLGPLAVVPGSFQAGPVAHSEDGVAQIPEGLNWKTTDFLAGDALLFHCHTLHRALPNRTTDQLRLSADFRFGLDAGSPRARVLGAF